MLKVSAYLLLPVELLCNLRPECSRLSDGAGVQGIVLEGRGCEGIM